MGSSYGKFSSGNADETLMFGSRRDANHEILNRIQSKQYYPQVNLWKRCSKIECRS